MSSAEDSLRWLATGGLDRSVAALPSDIDAAVLSLDARTTALVRLAVMVALGACAASYRTVVESAIEAGADADQVIATVLVVASEAGVARVVSAAPSVGLGLGYDVDEALESTSIAPQTDALGLSQ